MTEEDFKVLRKAVQGKYFVMKYATGNKYYNHIIKVEEPNRRGWCKIISEGISCLVIDGLYRIYSDNVEHWVENPYAFYSLYGERITPSEFKEEKALSLPF